MYYDILLGPNFVSTIQNREVFAIGRVLKYYINSPSIGTASSVHYMGVSTIGRCPLRRGSTVVACMHSHPAQMSWKIVIIGAKPLIDETESSVNYVCLYRTSCRKSMAPAF